MDPAALRRLLRSHHPFVRRAPAENSATPPDALAALCAAEDAPWNRNLLLLPVARRPRADLLASGERPYAAVLAAEDG
ncbi:hypothetical protein NI17_012260 [Thermobifida halotolerans]|uniref:Uncharacterized protein n=1 Tax=Thermobifida halotolerans TaxID=483545 RepID=A0AA97LTC8_9ACTN|nr:hypothetical protein [Thermobifida halotolerans]UOE17688.1 hypothetical protein NI17_012260 [Thermobifida halotolerans]